MKVESQPLSSDASYLDNRREVTIESKEPEYNAIVTVLRRFVPLKPETRIFEIGTGLGWLPILFKKHGLSCRGIDISPARVEYARRFGRTNGAEPDIEIGNIEDYDLGTSTYDVICAFSVFEHVEHWAAGLERIYRALRPGGVLYFFSTNRFSIRSDEFHLPFYGLLPNAMRYRLRMLWEGPDIMKLGIDFHQFNNFQLRRFFRSQGYSKVLDLFGIVESGDLQNPTPMKRLILRCIRFAPLRALGLVFTPGTLFLCVK